MALTGKYNFYAIKKWGARGLSLALATTTWGAWLLSHSFKPLLDYFFEFITNWLANRGLIVLNIGAIYVNGEFDQANFDSEMENAISKVTKANGKLTPAQIKEIDEKVIAAARKFLSFK